MTAFEIQGQQVTLPVEIREATAATASFLVSAGPANRIIGYSGLEVLRPLPGKAVCTLAFVNYLDGDLGQYHEFAVAFLVRAPATAPGRFGVFIHWLPVDQPFTLEAGRTIWGFPKLLTEITISGDGRGNENCAVYEDSTLVAGLSIRRGLSASAMGGGAAFDAYTHLNGRLRRTPWSMDPSGVRVRPGGAGLHLGDHPVAEELRSLGLPKTPIAASSIARLRMTFAAADEVPG